MSRSVSLMRHLPALLQSLGPDAGRVENWFVLNRLDSALRYHPVFTRRLGMVPAGAGPWISCGQPPQPLQRH